MQATGESTVARTKRVLGHCPFVYFRIESWRVAVESVRLDLEDIALRQCVLNVKEGG
jgi:hypothetical protein